MRKKESSKIIASLIVLLTLASASFAQSKGDMKMGVLAMVGGRYDNMRMCVASPSGTKGGPIADIMLTGRYGVNDNVGFGVNLPVMRPILFGLAFKMLQFEPEMVVDLRSQINDKLAFVSSPSLGISLHYGPDYKSDRTNRSPSFYAAGPIAGIHVGLGLKDENGSIKNIVGIKPFYVALFSKDHGTGTVIGGALEYQHLW